MRIETDLRPSSPAERLAYRDGRSSPGVRALPEEAAVSLTYNTSCYAVMMATPSDLEDFAVGFSLSEGIIGRPGDLEQIEIVRHAEGVEARMWLTPEKQAAILGRRRQMVGPTGCGLCGAESLEAAMRPIAPIVSDLTVTPAMVAEALAALSPAQALHRETSAVHGAGLWRRGEGLVAVREDVGRHNALDKLIGALARRGERADGGVLVLSSRVSVEMVQKAAVLGAPVVVAVSAPSALALRSADQAGLTLIAVARADGFEAFTHTRRIVD